MLSVSPSLILTTYNYHLVPSFSRIRCHHVRDLRIKTRAVSSTRWQPLLKRSEPRNRLSSLQIRDHLPHVPRSILHSHPSLFNPHTTSPTPRRTQSLSTFPPTSSVPSYPTLKVLRPRISSHPKTFTHNAKYIYNH